MSPLILFAAPIISGAIGNTFQAAGRRISAIWELCGKERSVLRRVRRCRPKQSKDVFETMKKLERDIRKQEPR